jgi:acetyltransferase-like isoleucine patch superfamily enzyme
MKFNNRNVYISDKAKIGFNVKIGDNSIIYDNVEIGDNTIISNDCVIGEPFGEYYQNSENFSNPITKIGSDSLIRSHAIIYSGSSFGNNFSTGHRVTIRENSFFGSNCRIGTLCDIQGNCEFGDYCWLHSNVHIGQGSKVGNFVFIYPYVVLTNDPTPPSNDITGVEIGDFSQIAVHSILLPGVKVGKHALIGASTVVTKNVGDYELILGNPGKFVKDVREIKSRETGDSHYPWPYRFDRGMPWQGSDFEKWTKENLL